MNVRTDLVVVYVLRPDDRGGHETLQLKRAPGRYLAGEWTICSGGIEPGETALEAAQRELKEETNLAPRRLSFLSHVETFFLPQTDTIWHRAGFLAIVDREDVVTLNHEHTACRWIARREISSEVLWPGERRSLAEIYREHLRQPPTRAARLRRVD